MTRATTLFEDAVDVPLWLDADAATAYGERVRRDREVARGLPPKAAPLTRARLWWQRVGASEAAATGARLDRLRALVSAAMVLLGAVTGVAVALSAFAYDGSEPVNVVRLLALLVGVQLALLALTLLLLPGRALGIPGLRDLPLALNPGAWAYGVFRKLARAPDEVARLLLDRPTRRTAAGRFARWQLLCWSQTAAVAFNAAAIVTAVALVTFSDLAFGWSTTLHADPELVAAVVRAAAWPWQAIAPSAVPSAELVAQSQFFRLGGSGSAVPPAALGAWWPFTVAAIVTYGLVPRLLLLALAVFRLRAATAALLLDDPRVTALLDRMSAPAIETAAATHDDRAPTDAPGAVKPLPRATGSAAALIWEGSTSVERAREHARRALGLDVRTLVEAGAGPIAADRTALERLAAEAPPTLLVLTPAWEPPLLELVDTLAELRKLLGPATPIVVVPVPDGERAVTDVERATWQRAIGRLADPKLYVEAGAA